jgi:peroxiredoxin
MARLQSLGTVVVLVCLGVTDCSIFADEAKSAKPPAVGETANDFALATLDDKKMSLHELTKNGPVVLVVLRGYPGYQCPLCTKQVAGLRAEAKAFQAAGAKVLLVYPGAADKLKERAKEFLKDDTLPAPLTLVLDPDYAFLKAYGLHWDAEQETSDPSTFVIDKDNKVLFSKVSKSHGGRAKAKEIVAALPKNQ